MNLLLLLEGSLNTSATARVLENLLMTAEQDAVSTVSIVFMISVALLALMAPSQRTKLRASLVLFASALCLLIGAALVAAAGLPAGSKIIHALALLCGGFAMVKLASIFFFDVILKVTHLEPPQVLRDLMVAVGYMAVGLWLIARSGVSLSGIVTTSALLTAVVAFSLQDSLGNMLGGLVLQAESTVHVGDWIKVDQTNGRVVEISWRHVAVETRNWETIIIPNSVLMRSNMVVIGKRTGEPIQWRRWVYFNVDFRIPPTEVIRVVTEALVSEPIEGAATDPRPNVILYDFKESYCYYAARYWLVDLPKDDPTDSIVRTRIFFALQRAGIPLSVPALTAFVETQDQERKKLHHEREVQRGLTALNLARVELFQNMTDEERMKLAEHLRFAPLSKGEMMTRQGAEAHWLYILTKGSAEVLLTVESGERRRVSLLHAGDFFGEMSLLTGEPRSATVRAQEDAECYRLDRQAFNDILQARPEIAQHLSEILARRKVELDAIRQDMDASARAKMLAQHQRSIIDSIYKMFGLVAKGPKTETHRN